MELLQTASVQCPCCGEILDIIIDCSVGDQEYVEDCQVCCEPLVMSVTLSDSGSAQISAVPENG